MKAHSYCVLARRLFVLCACITFVITGTYRDAGAAIISNYSISATALSVDENTEVFVQESSSVVIEAENFQQKIDRSGKAWTFSNDLTGFTGTGAMVATPDVKTTIGGNYAATSPELQYNVEFKTPGTYHVWIRAFADNGDSDTVHVGLDNQPVDSASNIRINRYREWQWRATFAVSSWMIEVPTAGVHTINVWMREDGFRFDRLILSAENVQPVNAGPAESPRRVLSDGGSPNPQPSPSPTPKPSPTPSPTPTPTPSPSPKPTPTPTVEAKNIYVAPYGSAQGKGDLSNPLDLVTALDGRSPLIKPGTIVWLRGGTYSGAFTSNLKGTEIAPVIVRSYPNEQAVFDGNGYSVATLTIKGSWTHYRDLEITNSSQNRKAQRATGIYMVGANTKVINCIVHDTGLGIGFWSSAVNAELYGNLIYNCGWDASDRGHGPAIYTQNQTGTKRIVDNIMFNQFSHGVQIYGSSAAYLNNYYMEGNASFMNGSPARRGFESNFHIGGGRLAQNPTMIDNFTYYTPNQGGRGAFVGYQKGSNNLVLKGNYFAGGTPVQMGTATNVTITGNTLYGVVDNLPAKYPNNTYYTAKPSGVKTFVRPNKFEAGRANIIVYNWDSKSVVDVDVSNVLQIGAVYEVRNAQDFLGAPVASGVYDGRALQLPTTNLKTVAPVGMANAPTSTGAMFNAYVLITRQLQ